MENCFQRGKWEKKSEVTTETTSRHKKRERERSSGKE